MGQRKGLYTGLLDYHFFKTYKVNLKNYDLESENHEHLIQNLLKGLMKVFSGVGEHNKHNTGLKEAQVSRRKVHTQSHTFSLKPEDTLDKISLEAYAALVSDLYRCRFGNKGTIPELLKYLDKRNPPPSLPKDEAERKRIYDTRMWLHTKDIEISLEIYLELAPVVLGYPHDCNQDLRLFLGFKEKMSEPRNPL
ncbi:hypothetical protein KEM48_007105 [Puccinia striiformis f. sp. tritici PST-130]|nr:hypothetical protein KEM48_007105 [Puccinia striiformis f. sp. tritici PST-130]